MTHIAIRSLLVGSLAAALAGGGAWVAEAAASPSLHQSKLQQPYGVNFTIHTSVDPNFCVEAPPDDGDARAAIVSQCVDRDDQHWTFVDASDGSIVLVDGIGQCVDYQGGSGTLIDLTPCTFTSAERFLYTAKGQIKGSSGKYCLQAAQSAQDAALFFSKCSKTEQEQVFMLGH